MKTRLQFTLAILLTLYAANITGQDRETQNRTRQSRTRLDPIFAALDTNRDGKLSAAELNNSARVLRTLDKSRDGKLSREEIFGSEERTGQRRRSGGGGSRLGGYETPPPANKVPAQLLDIILGRPTAESVTASILVYQELDGFLTYGQRSGEHDAETEVQRFRAGEPVEVVVAALEVNSRYYYRFHYRKPGATTFKRSDGFTFHTQRALDSQFTFTVQADSHLDENTSGELYRRTMANALADSPDFHLALGDTFMTGKYVRPELAHPQYLAQRYYFGQLCHSAPLFFALGNHDGESGNRGANAWATRTRKRYLPNPFPNGFYSGNEQVEDAIGLPENYYAWEWGNSQFIVLDPFRHTTTRSRSGDNWYRTLGKDQYQWLKTTLEESKAKFRFVFLHHLVGGSDRNSRGGAEAAPYFEWGGRSLDGKYGFDRERPGWGKPIHQMLIDHGATIVFHGHDHMFIKQELDGIIYQLVPQPGHPRFGNVRSAKEYGYLSGEIQSSSGHIRVRVGDDAVRVDYVRAYLADSETSVRKNGEVAFSYMIEANESSNREGKESR